MLARAKSRAEIPLVAISICTPSVIDLIAVPPVKITGARCNQRINHRFFPAFARFYADFALWRNRNRRMAVNRPLLPSP
jgi:hypothetical protein